MENRFLSNRYFNSQVARYYYRKGDVKNCLKYLVIGEITYKNIGMLLTVAFPALRKWVLNHFNISNAGR